MLTVGLALPIQLTVSLGAAAAFGPTPRRRWLGLLLACVAAGVPWLVMADSPLVTAFFVLGSLLPLFKVMESWRAKEVPPLGARVWYFLMPFDTRRARRGAPGVDVRRLFEMAAYAALFALAMAGCTALASASGLLAGGARLGLGLLMVYSMVEASANLLRLGHAAVGIRIPPIQRTPIAARTVREFWTHRWNRPVGEWLGRLFFLPLARRGKTSAAVWLTFLVSGVMHAWLVFVPLRDATMAVVMGTFFLLQAPFVLAELRLDVGRWRPLLGRLWTVLLLALASPLFVEPYLRIMGF